MNSQELEFIIKMRDEATAAIERLSGGLDGAAGSAGKAGKEAEKAGKGMDKAAKAAKDAQKQLKTLNTSFRKLTNIGAATVGLTSFYAVVSGGVRYIEDTGASIARFDRVMKNMGTSAQTSGKQLKKWAEDLERHTGRAAREILNASSNLASFGFDNDVFHDAIKLADDMGAAWGGDLQQNIEGLGRALDDPIRGFAMLRSRGITLTDSQARMVKQLVLSNKHLEAQKFIIETLQSQIGGSAEAGFSGLDKAISNSRQSVTLLGESFSNLFGLNDKLALGFQAVSYVLDSVRGVIDKLNTGMDRLPGPIKSTLQYVLLLGSAAVGLRAAFGSLKTALNLVGTLTGLGGAAGLAGTAVNALKVALVGAGAALKRFLPIALALIAGEAARRGGDWLAEWAERNLSQGTLDRLAAFRKEYEGFFDFMAQDPLSGVIQSGPNAGKNYWTGVQEYIQKDGQWVSVPAQLEIDTSEAKKAVSEAVEQATEISKDQLQALSILTEMIEKRQKLADAETALKAVIEATAQAREDAGITDQDIARAERLLKIERERNENPLYDDVRNLDDQIAGFEKLLASSIDLTGNIQNQLEIEKAINEAVLRTGMSREEVAGQLEKRLQDVQKYQKEMSLRDMFADLDDELDTVKAITAEQRRELEIKQRIAEFNRANNELLDSEIAKLREKVRLIGEAEKTNAFNDVIEGARRELEIARALTREDRERLAIKHEMADFEKEYGALTPDRKAEWEAIDAAKNQAAAYRDLLATVDPVGEATRRYEEEVRTLNRALAEGTITAQQYQQMLRTLDLTTRDARDPYGAQLRSLQQQIELAKIGGDYRDADRRTQETVNRLMEQGVTVTKEQVAALQAANRELQEIEKAQNSGLQGWVNSVGTLKDNLMDMTKDFASGLSDAIAGALEGKRGGFTALLRRLATNMISVGVNQMLKSAVQGIQGASGMGGGIGNWFKQTLGLGGSSPAATAQDTGKAVSDAVAAMTTANMSVTAGTVMINGTPVGMPGSGMPGSLSEGHQTFGIGPTEKITRQALAPVETASANAAKTIETSAWSLRGSIDDMAKTASTATRQFTDVSKVLPARADFPGVQRDGLGLPIPRPSVNVGSSVAGSAQGAFKDLAPKIQADLMRDLKLSREQAAGILGNLGGETGGFRHMQELNPLVKGSKGGYGWAQWTGPRRRQFEAWADKQGLARDSYSANYGFLKHELQGSEKGALAHLRQQTSVEDSTRSFLTKFERAGIPNMKGRLNYANQAYALGPQAGGTAVASAPGLDMMSTGAIQPQVQQVAQQWQQQMTTANQTLAQAMPQQFTPAFQNVGQQFEQVFNQSGSALQNLAPQFQQIGQQAQSIVPSLGGFGQSLTSLMGPLMQAPGATGQFGTAIMQLIQQMSSGMGGGGFGGIFGLLGGLFHKGGDVGAGHPASGYRMLPASTWSAAVKHHNGLKGAEYPAILKRGEKVLTANDNKRNSAVIEGLTDRLEQMQKNNSKQANRRFGDTNVSQNINVYAQDANSFRRSEGQLMADSSVKLRRLGGRNS